MGEDFKRKQARQYKERRDRAAPAFCKDDLLSDRPSQSRRVVRAEVAAGATVQEGQAAVLCADATTVKVVINNHVVGVVTSESDQVASRVRAAGGIVAGAVRDVSAIGGDFSVVVPDKEKSP